MIRFTRFFGKCVLPLAALALLVSAALPALADDDFKVVSTEILKDMLDEKKPLTLVDARTKDEFQQAHIAGAINILAESFAAKSGVLPKEKGIIVYCNSGGGSYASYRKLIKLAYPKIYQAILADWKDAGFPVVKSQL